jgi:hypothetical protein
MAKAPSGFLPTIMTLLRLCLLEEHGRRAPRDVVCYRQSASKTRDSKKARRTLPSRRAGGRCCVGSVPKRPEEAKPKKISPPKLAEDGRSCFHSQPADLLQNNAHPKQRTPIGLNPRFDPNRPATPRHSDTISTRLSARAGKRAARSLSSLWTSSANLFNANSGCGPWNGS